MTHKKKYGTIPGTDLTNLIDIKKFCPEYNEVCSVLSSIEQDLIKAHKKIFGRQDQTWIGGSENRRFFIWQIDELWILVHNVRGVVFEVPYGTTKERASELWNKYRFALGMPT